MNKQSKESQISFRKLLLVAFDVVTFLVVNLCFYLISHVVSNSVVLPDMDIFIYDSLVLGVSIFAFRLIFRIYSNIWRYTNTSAYFNMIVSDAVGGSVAILINHFVNSRIEGFYTGIWHVVIVAAITVLAALMARFAYRIIYKYRNKLDNSMDAETPKVKVAIAGAGQLGAYLANELKDNPKSNYLPVCFVDIDKNKIGSKIGGVPVYSTEKGDAIILKYDVDEVIIAINRLNSDDLEKLYTHYRELGCKVRIYDLPIKEEDDGAPAKRVIRDFTIEDLLFRKPVEINDQSSFEYYRGKTVLVTGGGGSIGSELCRQIAKCSPRKLIIVDIYENNAYDIQQELIRKYGTRLDLSVEIASVRDPERLDCIFASYRPDVVFHAAAHKHVPLMEHSGCEAIKNNVMGTYNTANCAEKYGVKKFILISTDKAVNPTNIMGASKRMCEMVILCRTNSDTSFAAVRFGNVLGSNGSVIPLFKRQIAAGGPVTITDKRIIRYFMTIPEASSLVIQAGAMAKRGELFVLDMGKPVKIYDLAYNMIKMMGYEPNKDIMIEEIGLRPGEKLYEELLMKTESLDKTPNHMIFIERDKPLTRDEVEEKLAILKEAVENNKTTLASPAIKEAIKRVVPTFVDPEEINKDAAKADEMKMVEN